jgi:hypothetical protein
MAWLHSVPVRKFWLTVILSSLLAVAPRFFYLNIPFDRDEGCYAYIADVIQRGGLPYVNAFDHKPPLIYYFYYLSFKLFGHSVSSPRILAALFGSVACLLLLLLVYRLTKNLSAAVISCLVFGLASTSTAYMGFSANTEQFTLPFLLGGMLLLADEEPSFELFFYAGLLFGVGFMVKQPVAVVAAVIFAYHWLRKGVMPEGILTRLLPFIFGSILPTAAVGLFFVSKGEFSAFWKSSFLFNFGYIAEQNLASSFSMLSSYLNHILRNDSFTWLMAFVSFYLFISSRISSFAKGYIYANLLGAIIAVSMGMHFYPHYFIFILPTFAIIIGIAIAEFSGTRMESRAYTIAILLLCFSCFSFAGQRLLPEKELLVNLYSDNTMAQARTVGDYLRANAPPSSTVFIIGSEPEILFYANLQAASRICYFYPLVVETIHREEMRKELLADLDSRPPDYVVVVNRIHSLMLKSVLNDKYMDELFSRVSAFQIAGIMTDNSDTFVTGSRQAMIELTSDKIVMMLLKRPENIKADVLTFGEIIDTIGN